MVQNVIDQAIEKFGRIDVLVNSVLERREPSAGDDGGLTFEKTHGASLFVLRGAPSLLHKEPIARLPKLHPIRFPR